MIKPLLVRDKEGQMVVRAEIQLANQEAVRFEARNLRRTNTGVHGYVEILDGETLLAWDTLNTDKNDQRTRLANHAHEGIEGVLDANGAPYTKKFHKHDFDLFCREIWDVWNKQFEPIELEGDVLSEPAAWIAEPHVISQGGTIIFGQPGSGKSYIGLLIASAVSNKVNNYWKVTQAKTLFVNLERSAESISRRIGAVNDVLGLDPDRKLLTLNARGRSLADVEAGIARAIAKLKVEFVVLDSISRSGMGDLNSNETGNAISDSLNRMGVTWLAIAHKPRSETKGGDHIYGSNMFDAAADIIVQQKATESNDETGVQLTVTKANDSAKARPMYFALKFDPYGLKAIRKSSGSDFPELMAEENQSKGDQIYSYLRNEVGRDTISNMSEMLNMSRTTLTQYLKKPDTYTSHRDGNKAYYSVKSNQEEK